ncbi:iron-sulfur cluster repair di-iron protein [Aquisalimonas sp.]|uniref:iron-sulfur cluster repair di-iron protein n=1 Tax=Aquisalimonas sp. TaxID=1872621 RepID=UPI0025BB3A10|nr:iron-sulfur cluster repair di-iron protein [Aquisalimonas sp.]
MQQKTIDQDLTGRTLAELAAGIPGASRVFREHRLDFCCGGDKTLRDAATARGLDPELLQDALRQETSEEGTAEEMTAAELVDHIETRYHAAHRQEIPELIRLARKVETVHREHPNVPAGLTTALEDGYARLDAHMSDEEAVLFPQIRARTDALLDETLSRLREDHAEHGELLGRLEALTNNFTPPEGACRTWQALYTGTEKFVADVMEHVHLENNVLFRRVSA